MAVSESIWQSALTTVSLIKSWLGTDEKLNRLPVQSSEYNIDADDWNKIVKGLAEVALRTRIGNVGIFTFSHPNVAASGTDVSLYRCGGGDTNLVHSICPFDGWVIGISARSENARTAGSCILEVEVDGTAVALTATIDGTNDQIVYETQTPVAAESAGDTVSAGDTIECVYTTDGTWAAGSTPSIICDVFIALGE